MKVDMSPDAVAARLRDASRLAGSLCAEARLKTKLDMGATAIAARLREASDLLELCRELRSASLRRR